MLKLASLIILTATCTVSRAADLPDFPFIHTQGTATAQHAPQAAKISLTVSSFHLDAGKGEQLLTQRTAAVLKLCQQAKVQPEDIESHEVDKYWKGDRRSPHTPAPPSGDDFGDILDSLVEDGANDERPSGYMMTRDIRIPLDDLAQYNRLVQGLLKLEEVNHITPDFFRNDDDKIQEELIAKACADARQSATRLAKGMGRSLGDIFAISERGFQDLGAYYGLGSDALMGFGESSDYFDDFGGGFSDKSPNTVLMVPKKLTYSASVSALFKLDLR